MTKISKEHFIIKSHDSFKNLILGYQKHKTSPLRSKPMKFNDNPSVLSERRSTSSELVQWGEFQRFRNFNFRKTDRFNITYHNLNDYVKEIRRFEQENLENQPSLSNDIDSSSGKRKQIPFALSSSKNSYNYTSLKCMH